MEHSSQAALSPDMAPANELEFDLKKVVRGEVRFDDYSRILYSTDAASTR